MDDIISETVTKREFDLQGKMTSETLATGLHTRFEYDDLGRMIAILYPDGSNVQYIFEGMHLMEIRRNNGETLYSPLS